MFNGQNQPGQPQNQIPPPVVKFEDIHVMPERFMSPDTHKGGKKNNNTVLIIILAAVLLLGGGAAATVYFLVKPNNKNSENANQQNQNAIRPVNTANLSNSGNGNINGSANGNANNPLNFNANQNSNFSINTNRSNLNSNGSANLNSNANRNLNTNSPAVRTAPLPSTLDTDSDGLTDVEEALFGTMANKPDTDGDGYIDGKRLSSSNQCGESKCYDGEVYNGYNPLSSTSGSLDTSGLVTSFRNSIFNYAILYPAQWIAQSNSDNRTTLFVPSDPTGETIQVIVSDNPSRLTALNYYRSINPGINSALLETVTVNGLEGVRTPTGEDVYFAKADKIYNVSYSAGQLPALNFMTTFEMMFRSFRLTSG